MLEIYDLGFYIYKIQIRNCHQECANSVSFGLVFENPVVIT